VWFEEEREKVSGNNNLQFNQNHGTARRAALVENLKIKDKTSVGGREGEEEEVANPKRTLKHSATRFSWGAAIFGSAYQSPANLALKSQKVLILLKEARASPSQHHNPEG
jgi:hypothetical protein